jgi:PIN domain nuclease of toxin-antitoxin system
MNLLLDTHTLLWFYSGDAQLSQKLKIAIMNPSVNCYISIASLWEITIKNNIGKLELKDSLDALFQFISRNNIVILSIELEHLLQINALPFHHKD